jgi:hypothetical protein
MKNNYDILQGPMVQLSQDIIGHIFRCMGRLSNENLRLTRC